MTALFLFLTGCKVGQYRPPEVVVPTEFSEDQSDKTFEADDEDLVDWWSIFNDPFLDQLLDIAIIQNFNYRIALEQVYQARANYWVQFTQILPEFDASALGTRYDQANRLLPYQHPQVLLHLPQPLLYPPYKTFFKSASMPFGK